LSDWLYDRLGVGLLREDAQGGFTANARASELISGAQHPSLVTALAPILGQNGGAELEEALVLARAGVPSELVATSGARVLLAQDAPGRALAIVLTSSGTAATTDVGAQVSHELANALGAIAGWARLARQGHRVDEALRLIEMSADSAWSAARRLLGDARARQKSEPEIVELSVFVDEAAKLLGPKALIRGVRVRTNIEPELRVRADRGSVWSIVWNLSANAVEAMTSGGVVELRLALHGSDAVLTIEDDGPGMSEEQQRKAFEPYFTTKPTGTGLGLAVVHQAVNELGGQIALKSEPGLGTRFTVSLPHVERASQRPAQPTKRSSGVFYSEPLYERVLVVDDDLGLREMIATALGMRGAEVVAVGTAEAALAQRGRFGVVVIDLLLGDMRGDALLAALRQAGLARVGLLMTGAEIPESLAPGGTPDAALRKPFELEELFETLGDVLKRGARDRRSATG
jgi:signal transduction histidine kinase